MSIHNLICPGCHSSEYIENITNSKNVCYWVCNSCKTKIFTHTNTGELYWYKILATYKGVQYAGVFIMHDLSFRLDFESPEDGWYTIFELPFAPKFDANNFLKKLPTLLTFS